MVKTLVDGFPDEPWDNEHAQETEAIIEDIERQLHNAPALGRRAVYQTVFERERQLFEPGIFRNDPYHRISQLNLN